MSYVNKNVEDAYQEHGVDHDNGGPMPVNERVDQLADYRTRIAELDRLRLEDAMARKNAAQEEIMAVLEKYNCEMVTVAISPEGVAVPIQRVMMPGWKQLVGVQVIEAATS